MTCSSQDEICGGPFAADHALARNDHRMTRLYTARYHSGGQVEQRQVCFNHYMQCMHGLDPILGDDGVVRYEAVEASWFEGPPLP